ncbi:Sporulation protein YpjB [Mycoavidus cysteinexigens]|uniref:Sporulation protein YpjB n=1 Tax=Mycoavidus cysteinexigens TaxID=1553431 RepID=A0A2Z6EVE5_9BURK|nr:Sporulation protein YpjB [Mycoavidus cysteinexigens]GLR01646.1 hypothetical protein GCM10007934_14580 [Mycoavidus cysteinexigens]
MRGFGRAKYSPYAKRGRIKAPADTQQRFDAAIQNLSKFNNDRDPRKETTSELNKDFYICQSFI